MTEESESNIMIIQSYTTYQPYYQAPAQSMRGLTFTFVFYHGKVVFIHIHRHKIKSETFISIQQKNSTMKVTFVFEFRERNVVRTFIVRLALYTVDLYLYTCIEFGYASLFKAILLSNLLLSSKLSLFASSPYF